MAIIPVPGDLTGAYWAAARRHELTLQRCAGCGWLGHPPLPRCPRCHGTDLGRWQASGRGTVHSFTIVTHATHAALTGAIPYVVAVVELAEGPRLVAGIRGCAPERVRVGMPVSVVFEDLTEEITLPQFEPAGEDHA